MLADATDTISLMLNAGPTVRYLRASDRKVDQWYLPNSNRSWAADFASCGLVDGNPVMTGCSTATNDLSGLDASGRNSDQKVSIGYLAGSEPSEGPAYNWYAAASVEKRFVDGLLKAAYSRAQNVGSGRGAATVSNTVTLTGRWAPAPHWVLGATGRWTRQETDRELSNTLTVVRDSGVPIPNSTTGGTYAEAVALVTKRGSNHRTTFTQYRATFRVTHELTNRIKIDLDYDYDYGERDGLDSAGDVDTTSHTGTVMLTFEFDPYSF